MVVRLQHTTHSTAPQHTHTDTRTADHSRDRGNSNNNSNSNSNPMKEQQQQQQQQSYQATKSVERSYLRERGNARGRAVSALLAKHPLHTANEDGHDALLARAVVLAVDQTWKELVQKVDELA